MYSIATYCTKPLNSTLSTIYFCGRYLMPSVSRLYYIDDRMIGEYGAVGGTRIDRGN
jgi:hypothetical protein